MHRLPYVVHVWTVVSLGVLTAAIAGGAPSSTALLLAAIGITDADQRDVEAGTAVVVVRPAEGRDLAVAGATRTSADGRQLAAWSRSVERLYQGRYTGAIRRFASPPQLSDVAALTLEDEDLEDLKKCRPGDCAVKLAAAEIDAIRAAAHAAGDDWKPAVQLAFRRVVLERARQYLDGGIAAAPPYHDHEATVSPAAEFEAIADRFEFEPFVGAHVLPYFRSFPEGGSAAGVESFLFWSMDLLGAGKPIISITHVAVLRCSAPGVAGTVVAARQVFSNHYLTGSLSITLLTDAPPAPGYLLYLRHSRTDAFQGVFGGLVRRLVERRIRSEAPGVLDELRRKLEAGDPPPLGTP